MIYAVLSTGGVVTGYVVGEYYLSVERARMYFDILPVAKQVYGTVVGNFLISNVTGDATAVKAVDYKEWVSFVSTCVSEKAQLHKVVFAPCRYSDVIYWRSNGIWKLDGCYCYVCMSGVDLLGYLLLNTDLFRSKSVMVVMIETIEKSKGHGSLIVEELKYRGIKLSGISTVEAAPFWRKHGADLQEYNRFHI